MQLSNLSILPRPNVYKGKEKYVQHLNISFKAAKKTDLFRFPTENLAKVLMTSSVLQPPTAHLNPSQSLCVSNRD